VALGGGDGVVGGGAVSEGDGATADVELLDFTENLAFNPSKIACKLLEFLLLCSGVIFSKALP
jgi:hypothetical protein